MIICLYEKKDYAVIIDIDHFFLGSKRARHVMKKVIKIGQ